MQKIIMSVLLAIVGILAIGVGIYLAVIQVGDYKPTTATITGFEVQGRPGKRTITGEQVEYVVDGVSYTAVTNTYSSKDYTGREIKIYYNPENPAEIKASGTTLGVFFAAIGLVTLVFSALILITGLKNGK